MEKAKKDPYVEIFEILQSYEEGLPPRTPDAEECSCRMHDAECEDKDTV